MASKGASDKRANLVASRLQWSHMDHHESSKEQESQGSSQKDSVRRWLTTTVTEEDAKQEPLWKASEPLGRTTSSDDDLALGVEASLYFNKEVRTVKDFLRWSRASPNVSRWNSFNSSVSDQSGPLSVMDILNLWNDDPVEVLLDLGFGFDEPDLSGRIPARFINYQSQARGINLQVFLEAQKSRLDLENPDVSNRFRQLEVLQQVTTAFSSLVGSVSSPRATQGKELLPEARERRRRMCMLLRRASKKTLSNMKNQKSQDVASADTPSLSASPETHPPLPSSLGDNRIPLKRMKTGIGKSETSSLSPLAEEQGVGPDTQLKPEEAMMITPDGSSRSWTLRDSRPLSANPFLQRKRSPGQGRESFEMEEIHSFDEGNFTGSCTGAAENLVRGLARTNSCQSDSSGFLEEPFIPSQCQQETPAADLIKALSNLSGGSTESHSSERPGSPSNTSPLSPPCLQLSSSLTSPDVGKDLLSSSHESLEQSVVLDLSPDPVSSCPLKSDHHVKETETKPDQDESQSASLPSSCSQFEIPPSLSTSVSPSASLIEPASLGKGLEEIKTEEKDSPSPDLSTFSDCTAYSDFSCLPPPALSSSPKSDLASFSTVSSFRDLGTTQSQQTKGSPGVTSQKTSSPNLQINPKEHHDHDPDPPSSALQTEKDLPLFLSSPLDQDNPSAPPPFCLDSSSNEWFASQSFFSPDPSAPDCQSRDQECFINPAEGRIPDFTEELVSQRDRPLSKDDKKHIDQTVPVQEDIPSEINYLSLDSQDNLKREGKAEIQSEGHFDAVSNQDTCNSGFKTSPSLSDDSGLSKQNEHYNSLNAEPSAETEPEEFRNVCEMEIEDTESLSPIHFPMCDEDLEAQIRNELKPKGLCEIESLDVVFQTSVDGSEGEGEGEGEDLDAFLQQLDTERHVYWAEPIQVSNMSTSLDESESFEASERSPPEDSLQGQPVLDSSSSTGRALSVSSPSTNDGAPKNQDPKPSSRSVSVQMSSSPSSHIIHRKDVPYVSDSKHSLLPAVLPLDTSTPFRAVQSWTDLHIHRNNLPKMFSHGAADRVPNEAMVSTGSLETMQRPTMIISSSQSFPLLSKDWHSYDSLPGMDRDCPAGSVSLDKELWSDGEEEVDGNKNEDEKNLWEGNKTSTMACCCSCDHHAASCYNTQQSMGDIPYSLDELEEMMLCLQQFRSVLCNMEQQLSEDQASVYSALCDQDRKKVRDIEELRQAVKKEVGELEMHLNELAHHYDDSLKMKMHRLLDEQSLLCTQLRVPLPGKWSTTLHSSPNRTVATQCCLHPQTPRADGQKDHVSSWYTWNQDSPRQSPPGSDSNCEGLNCSPTKVDKVDIVSFLHRLKETLRHSVNADSLE